MIIGGSKAKVIENIKKCTQSGQLNDKVEMGDPNLTAEQSDKIVYGYAKNRNKVFFKIKSFAARGAAAFLTNKINKTTDIVGLDKLSSIKGGAIVTCNHFNPLDNTTMRYLAKKAGNKRLYTVAQETNFAMEGFVGFFMNYADIIPISRNMHYMQKEFSNILSEHISKGKWVLIYPEQEMWFNYRRPRPLKDGAYHFAAKFNVPIISCFVEMTDEKEADNDEFFKVKYTVHVLDPIFPDKEKNTRENSRIMQKTDSEQRTAAYRNIYKKELDSPFDVSDIAGYRGTVE